MGNDRQENAFGEPLFLPQSFTNPNAGRYKAMAEKWWSDRKVHLLIEVDVDRQPQKYAVWLHVLRFEDQILDGRPVRIGVGRLENPINCDHPQAEGVEMFFDPEEVFDVTEPQPHHEGEYVQLWKKPPEKLIIH
jgi:hypothetical protein